MKIFLIGFMGAGKTYLGKIVSEKLKIPFFDLDEQIVNNTGQSIPEIFATKGEEQFRLLETDALHILIESQEHFVLSCGGGTPCFYNNIDFMNQSGITVWINTPHSVLLERLLKEKENRPLVKKLTEEELSSFILRKMVDRKIYYEQAKIYFHEDSMNIDDLIQKIFHA